MQSSDGDICAELERVAEIVAAGDAATTDAEIAAALQDLADAMVDVAAVAPDEIKADAEKIAEANAVLAGIEEGQDELTEEQAAMINERGDRTRRGRCQRLRPRGMWHRDLVTRARGPRDFRSERTTIRRGALRRGRRPGAAGSDGARAAARLLRWVERDRAAPASPLRRDEGQVGCRCIRVELGCLQRRLRGGGRRRPGRPGRGGRASSTAPATTTRGDG